MAARPGKRGSGRCSPGRALLVLALLPALLLGPAFGGVAAWIHSHGPAQGHVHWLPDDHDHDVAAFDGWHAAQHRRGHEHGDHEEGPAPTGLLVELPGFVAASARGSTVPPTASLQALALLPLTGWHLALVLSSTRPGPIRSGWPPGGTERSGVAALLRSSHAILI